MTLEMWFVVAMIIIPLTLVVLNRWRVDVAALFMMVVLGLAQFLGFSILGDASSPQQTLLAISGFGQPVVVTLIGLFILTQTLTNNGVMLWLGQQLAMAAVSSVTRLIFVFTFSSALLSLLMNNVAVGALLLPSAMQAARQGSDSSEQIADPNCIWHCVGRHGDVFHNRQYCDEQFAGHCQSAANRVGSSIVCRHWRIDRGCRDSFI